MSIATELTRLNNAKAAIKSSIENKGVTVPSNAKLDTYSTYVDAISQGITPSGTINITSNGTHDVTNYANANVNVESEPNIETVTASTSSNATSISFNVKGQPKAFMVQLGQQNTLATTYYVTSVMYDGDTTYGTYCRRSSGGGSSAYEYYSASYFSFTYSNGILTVTTSSSTNGGYFRSGYTYRLIYIY